ncbi:MAG: hypothetical protein AB8B54_10020 [Sphingorhabdus sp.]
MTDQTKWITPKAALKMFDPELEVEKAKQCLSKWIYAENVRMMALILDRTELEFTDGTDPFGDRKKISNHKTFKNADISRFNLGASGALLDDRREDLFWETAQFDFGEDAIGQGSNDPDREYEIDYALNVYRGVRIAKDDLNDELLLAGLGGKVRQGRSTAAARPEGEKFIRNYYDTTPKDKWLLKDAVVKLAASKVRDLSPTQARRAWSEVAPSDASRPGRRKASVDN